MMTLPNCKKKEKLSQINLFTYNTLIVIHITHSLASTGRNSISNSITALMTTRRCYGRQTTTLGN